VGRTAYKGGFAGIGGMGWIAMPSSERPCGMDDTGDSVYVEITWGRSIQVPTQQGVCLGGRRRENICDQKMSHESVGNGVTGGGGARRGGGGGRGGWGGGGGGGGGGRGGWGGGGVGGGGGFGGIE